MMDSAHTGQLDLKPEKPDRPRVLLDLDGVIRDFVGSLVRTYTRLYPGHQVQPVTSRKLEDFFPIGLKIYDLLKSDVIVDIMENAPAYPRALEDLHRWKNEFEIVIVSAQPDEIKSSTFTWIGKHDIPTHEVHISYYKSEIAGLALLDDFVDNLKVFEQTGRLAICMDQPWNQHWSGKRVTSVDQFFRVLQGIMYSKGGSNINQPILT